ncbi:MAG: hypothetical protein WA705_21230 [Candidatus Ozemobacteraceae bacterium]
MEFARRIAASQSISGFTSAAVSDNQVAMVIAKRDLVGFALLLASTRFGSSAP